MATVVNGVLSDTTTPDDFELFWPNVEQYFADDVVDRILATYIRRAEILLNLVGSYNASSPNFNSADIQIMANLLVRRLIWADNHPATSGEAAGVKSEYVKGSGYTLFGPSRTLEEIVGSEIIAMATPVLSSTALFRSRSIQVFAAPVLFMNTDTGVRELFDLTLDDILQPGIAERNNIRAFPALELPGRFAPFGELFDAE